MRRVVVGGCTPENIFEMNDPSIPGETEFEYSVAEALTCLYPNYTCVVFGGSFQYDDRVFHPDLALVAKDFSHWFIIEVELVSHSLNGHVIPQVRAFKYGSPLADCAGSLSEKLGISRQQAHTLIEWIPRSVVVIANQRDPKWEFALNALDIQLLSVSILSSSRGVKALEVDGVIEVFEENLGFGVYSATDRSVRFHKLTGLPVGLVQINDTAGILATWQVVQDGDTTWVTKKDGYPLLENGTYVQLIKTFDNRFSFRQPLRDSLTS